MTNRKKDENCAGLIVCEKIFVRWSWLIGILLPLIGTGIVLGITYGSQTTDNKRSLQDHESRLVKVEKSDSVYMTNQVEMLKLLKNIEQEVKNK